MNIIGGPPEAPFPKNVGLLFFNDEPWRYFPATQIDVVWFPEGAGGDRFEEKVFRGPLGRITRDAIDYIRRNYLKETVIKHPDRAEAERFWNFPYLAIEEAVVNAVYHRSYEEREPVEVRITAEDLTVLSFPGPDRSIRMDDLRAGRAVSRRYRNRRIGEFLKELDLTEGRSTGIPKILRAMQANGSPAPEFDTDEDRSYYLIRLPVHEGVDQKDTEPSERSGAESGPESGPESRLESGLESATSGNVLLALAEQPLGRSEIAATLGHGSISGAVNRAVRELMEKNLIEYTLPEKPNSRLQKYRPTPSGQAYLQERENPS